MNCLVPLADVVVDDSIWDGCSFLFFSIFSLPIHGEEGGDCKNIGCLSFINVAFVVVVVVIIVDKFVVVVLKKFWT